MSEPFWRTKKLHEMTRAEWESLCDGCGLCCLVRFEDEDTGEIIPTRVHCRLFDNDRCRCSRYAERQKHVPDCVSLTPENVPKLAWIPLSCAYRRLAEGKDLPAWHPLVTGDPMSVHAARVSIRLQTFSEDELDQEEDALDEAAPEWLADRSDWSVFQKSGSRFSDRKRDKTKT